MKNNAFFLFLFVSVIPQLTNAQTEFITIWETTSAAESITIPLSASTGANLDIDWGDSTPLETGLGDNPSHTYTTAGSYVVTVTGTYDRIFFNATGDYNKILDVSQWGTNQWLTMENAFDSCINLEMQAIDNPDLSLVTNMDFMFKDAAALDQSIDTWDVSNVISMKGLFQGCLNFNQDLNSWNVSSVTDMNSLFKDATNFNGNISSWDVSSVLDMDAMFFLTAFDQDISTWQVDNVTSMQGTFNSTPFNQDINGWNVSSVTSMSALFQNCGSFNQNLNQWDVSSVENMVVMFNSTPFNQDIESWDVGNVQNMNGMFLMSEFNQDLNGWNVSNVTDMALMFAYSPFNKNISGWGVSNVSTMLAMFAGSTFNSPITGWNTSTVNNMSYMFYDTQFNQDISAWDVSSVTEMDSAFAFANNFDQNLGGWDVSNVTSMEGLLTGVTLSTSNYDDLLIGWANLTLELGISFDGGNSQYCAGADARQSIVANYGWTIVDGGLELDITVPMITCPGNQAEPADAFCELSLPDYTGTATVSDNCDTSPIVTQLPVAGTMVSGAGTIETITLTATDASGNSSSCVTTVSVLDNTAPDAQCQPFTLVLDPSGSGTLTTGDIDNGSSDNCGIASLALDINTFNCSNIGANTVELTVEDNNGLVSTCTETVTVADNEVPVFDNCPTDIEVCADDATGVTVTYATITATDNCSSSVSQTDVSGLTNGNLFPIGVTPQQWTATDGTNSVVCNFNVTVNATPVADYSYSPSCEGESTFFTDESTIDASTSITTWEWDMGDGSSSIGLVDPIHAFGDTGMYDVELVVISTEGCSDTATQTVHVTPVPVAGFTFVGDCEGNATVFTNTSSIDAFPSASTLTSAWDFGDSNTSTLDSPSHVYALDGTYTVTLTVTSDNGCEDVITQSVTVSDSPTSLFSASTECEGTATTFTNLSTGDGTLTYSWDFGDLSPASTDANPTYTYTTDGVYTVVLTTTNDNGCVDTHTASVTVNNLPAASFTFSDVCEGTAADFVNTSDAGTYNWDLGDGNSSTLTDVSHVYSTFGTYDVTLTVTSPEFCISSVTQTIEIFDLPDFTLTATDVLCYGESTGELVAVAVPPAATPWTLSIDGGTPQASVTFGALATGTYDITAFDANGCEFTVSGTVSQPSDTLGISVNSTVDVFCNGEATGEINVNGTGGTSPYMYSVDAGAQQMTGMFAGLEAGTHDIQIVDANLCVFDTIITLAEPDTLVLTLVNTEDLLCNGDNSGEIAVVGTGGVLDYEYNVDGGTYGSDSLFTGLSAGMHIVGVLDANGCTDTLHVTLTEPGILQLSLVTANDAVCFGESNGSIEVAAASGTAPYQFSIDGVNFQGSALFEGLAAGTYTVTVMDANGCLDELTETIFEPSLVTIETSSVPVACFGDASGEITVTADGGTPVYEYSNDGGISFDANGGLFSDVVTGNYLMVVRDANGCTASEGVIISQPASVFILDANVTDAACLDSTSGSVQLIGTGGTPTYLYSADNTSFDADGLVEGFGAGTYTLYGQDLNGCSDSVDVVIGEPSTSVEITSTILANPACPNEASGTATITAFGGTPGYTYSSNGGATYQAAATLTGLNGGNHLLFVQDANGCVDSDTITLVAPEIFDLTLDSIVGVDCEGDFTGEIHVTGVGGTPSYNYFLDGTSLQSNGDYIGLSDGVYAVSIMDVNGCTYAEDIVIVAAQMLPTADFDFAISGTAVAFENLSQFGDTYLWEFGDDSTSTEMSPVHVYAEDGNYDVTLTVTNSCGSETITILVSTTTIGINDNEVLTFGLYPNPTSNQLFIQPSMSVNTELTFEVISTSGQIILTKQIPRMDNAETVQLDVSGMASGIYYLKIVGNDQQSVLRFDIIK